MMQTQRVDQSDAAELLERLALAVGAHDGAAPKVRVVNVLILRRDVEVAADDQMLLPVFALQAIPQPGVPLQLVSVGRRSDRLTVWRVDGINAQCSDGDSNHARLRVFLFVAKRGPHFAWL